jgi:hypothetical protein
MNIKKLCIPSKESETHQLTQGTGEAPITPPPAQKNQAAVELGRLGGKKGGKARAESLTPEERSEIAKRAAQIRWKE